jgi:hypothetical protein
MSKHNPPAHESAQSDLLSSTGMQAPAVVKPSSLSASLAKLLPKIAELDQFADNNSLALLTENKGQFESAIMLADAINQLKAMLTHEVMAPIMALQGTPLGFRTDKDSTGGYPVEVVRDAFIEAVLKGFKVVGNEMNIIAGRGYITREGFEGALSRLGRKGFFTDFKDTYSVPRIVSDSEAIVTASASWKWKGIVGKIENAQFSIRMNKGMGADGAIGKAKRKLKARVYERITGTCVTEGDTTDAPVIDIQTTPASGTATQQQPAGATEDQKTLLKELLDPQHVEHANAWLLGKGAIPAGGSYLDVRASMAEKILGKPKDFLAAITPAGK